MIKSPDWFLYKSTVQGNTKKQMPRSEILMDVWVTSLGNAPGLSLIYYCSWPSLLCKQLWQQLLALPLCRSLGTNAWQKGSVRVSLMGWSVSNDFLQVLMGMLISLWTDSFIHQFMCLLTHSLYIYWALTMCQAILCLILGIQMDKVKVK